MDPNDNVFDMKTFERLCEEQVDELRKLHDLNGEGPNKISSQDERRIMMGDHYWTVISKVTAPLTHPFDPPAPFTERLSKLRPNNRIRISRWMATKEPLPRTVWTNEKLAGNKSSETKKKKGFVSKETRDLSRHSDPGAFIASHDSIDQVPYKTAYSKPQAREGPKKGKVKITAKMSEIAILAQDNEPKKDEKKKKKTPAKGSIAARMKEFNLQRPPKDPVLTLDGVSPMACLKQLEDIGVVGALLRRLLTPHLIPQATRMFGCLLERGLIRRTRLCLKICFTSKIGISIWYHGKPSSTTWPIWLCVLLWDLE